MRPAVLHGVVFGIGGGLVTCALQLVLTPANMMLFSLPIALLIGVAVGLSVRRSATRATAPQAAAVEPQGSLELAYSSAWCLVRSSISLCRRRRITTARIKGYLALAKSLEATWRRITWGPARESRALSMSDWSWAPTS
jgi:hypothetical protein